jgi:hypothetical protein
MHHLTTYGTGKEQNDETPVEFSARVMLVVD